MIMIIIRDLLINLSVFAATILFYSLIFNNVIRRHDDPDLLKERNLTILTGIIFGVTGTFLLFCGFYEYKGTLIDLRHLAIVVSAYFGGVPAALITGFFIGLSRIIFFGELTIPSYFAFLNAINMAIGTGVISELVKKRKWTYMILYCVVSISAVLSSFFHKDVNKLIFLLIIFWVVTIISGYAIKALIHYIEKMNQLQKQIQKSESKYRIITENMTDIVTVIDRNGLILYASPSYKTTLGFEHESIFNTYMYEYIHPDDLCSVKKKCLELFGNREIIEIHFRWKHADGYWLDIDMRGKPIVEENGKINQVVLVSRDISKRIQAEKQLKEILQELQDMKFALDQASIVSISDEKGIITSVNDKFCELTGYSREEVIGKSHKILNSGYHPKGFFKELWDTINRGEVWKGEVRNVSKIGEYRWFETTIVPFIKNGVPYHVAVRTDLTERKIIERQMKKLSNIDGLTEISNRRYFNHSLQMEWDRLAIEGEPVSLLLMDIDHFKQYNDIYGHLAGDHCLKQVAKKLMEVVHSVEYTVARYGGEEFAIILPNTFEEKAVEIANKIRAEIELLEIPHTGSCTSDIVTISIGVATMIPDSQTKAEQLIEAADQALYTGKRNGRNQVNQHLIPIKG